MPAKAKHVSLVRVAVVGLLALLLMGPLLLYGLLSLPNTPEGWFTYHTGLAFPADAQVVEDRSDYSQGMYESLATEGSGCYAFKASEATINAWLAKSPPWQNEWSHRGLTTPNWIVPLHRQITLFITLRPGTTAVDIC